MNEEEKETKLVEVKNEGKKKLNCTSRFQSDNLVTKALVFLHKKSSDSQV